MKQRTVEPTKQKPPEQKTTEIADSKSSTLVDQINAATGKKQTATFWTCKNVKRFGPPNYCNCVTGDERTIPGGGPPGASRNNKVFVSNNRAHWYAPVRCDAQGNWLEEEDEE